MTKFFAAILCSGVFFGLAHADLVQKAGDQQFRWNENGTLKEYRVGDRVASSGAAALFSALDAETGREAGFIGKFSPAADGAVRYRGSASELALDLEILFRPDIFSQESPMKLKRFLFPLRLVQDYQKYL